MLVDRDSQFTKSHAKRFLQFFEKVRQKENDPNLRGAILCHQRKLRQSQGKYIFPFPRTVQVFLLQKGIVILSIPDPPVPSEVPQETSY